jgi:enterochelin esterase family protein
MGSSIRPAIAVFVDSTSGFEYARTFRAAHQRLMVQQLVPLIDGQYRTLAQPGQRLLWGVDEAGFAAVETALRHPAVFGSAIAQSAFSLTRTDAELLALVDATPKSAQRFYLDWGRYDPRRVSDGLDVPGFTRALADRLRGRGFDVTAREWNDGSAVPFWTERSLPALRLMVGR